MVPSEARRRLAADAEDGGGRVGLDMGAELVLRLAADRWLVGRAAGANPAICAGVSPSEGGGIACSSTAESPTGLMTEPVWLGRESAFGSEVTPLVASTRSGQIVMHAIASTALPLLAEGWSRTLRAGEAPLVPHTPQSSMLKPELRSESRPEVYDCWLLRPLDSDGARSRSCWAELRPLLWLDLLGRRLPRRTGYWPLLGASVMDLQGGQKAVSVLQIHGSLDVRCAGLWTRYVIRLKVHVVGPELCEKGAGAEG